MKKNFPTALLLAFVFISVFCFSACKPEEPLPSESYVYHPADETQASQEQTTAAGADGITVNTLWRSNFEVYYTYFNSEQSEETLNVCEKRSENYFSAEDTASGDMLYYCASGADIDSYVIVPGEAEQAHTVISGKTLADLSSTFMKLSEVDSDLPSLPNVLYMYDEAVAGRDCAKYIQRAYSGGELTKTVYVWIDAEFGFAAKGEVYNADTELIASWEVQSFSAGATEDADVQIDLSGYTISEE